MKRPNGGDILALAIAVVLLVAVLAMFAMGKCCV